MKWQQVFIQMLSDFKIIKNSNQLAKENNMSLSSDNFDFAKSDFNLVDPFSEIVSSFTETKKMLVGLEYSNTSDMLLTTPSKMPSMLLFAYIYVYLSIFNKINLLSNNHTDVYNEYHRLLTILIKYSSLTQFPKINQIDLLYLIVTRNLINYCISYYKYYLNVFYESVLSNPNSTHNVCKTNFLEDTGQILGFYSNNDIRINFLFLQNYYKQFWINIQKNQLRKKWEFRWKKKINNVFLAYNESLIDPDIEEEMYEEEYHNLLHSTENTPQIYLDFYKNFINFYQSFRLIGKKRKQCYQYRMYTYKNIISSDFDNWFISDVRCTWLKNINYTIASVKYTQILYIVDNLFSHVFTYSNKTSKTSNNIGSQKNLAFIAAKSFIKYFQKHKYSQNLLNNFKKFYLMETSKATISQTKWWNIYGKTVNRQLVKKSIQLHNVSFLSNTSKIHKFNNYFPLFGLKRNLFLKYYSTYLDNSSPVFSMYFNYYFLNFLETYLKSKVWVKINTKTFVPEIVSREFIKLTAQTKQKYSRIGKHLFINELYDLLWLSLYYKDLALFAKWFKMIMQKIHHKHHKLMIKLVFITIKNNSHLFLVLTGTKGFSIDVRGKLGVTGNAKKRHLAFTAGKVTLTSKKYPLHYYNTIINTDTGVLGVTLFIMD